MYSCKINSTKMLINKLFNQETKTNSTTWNLPYQYLVKSVADSHPSTKCLSLVSEENLSADNCSLLHPLSCTTYHWKFPTPLFYFLYRCSILELKSHLAHLSMLRCFDIFGIDLLF